MFLALFYIVDGIPTILKGNCMSSANDDSPLSARVKKEGPECDGCSLGIGGTAKAEAADGSIVLNAQPAPPGPPRGQAA